MKVGNPIAMGILGFWAMLRRLWPGGGPSSTTGSASAPGSAGDTVDALASPADASQPEAPDEETLSQAQLAVLGRVCDRLGAPDVSAAFSSARDARSFLHPIVEEALATELVTRRPKVSSALRERIVGSVLDEMVGFGPIQPLLVDPSVEEIRVIGPQRVHVVQAGQARLTDCRFRDADHLLALIRRIMSPQGLEIWPGSPPVEARLPDGSIAVATVPAPGSSPDGLALTIRKPTETTAREEQERRVRSLREVHGDWDVEAMERVEAELQSAPDGREVGEPRPDDHGRWQIGPEVPDRLVDALRVDLLAQAPDDSARHEIIRRAVESVVSEVAAQSATEWPGSVREEFVQDVMDEVIGLGPIEHLLRDPGVTEIRVLGPTQVYAVQGGKLRLTGRKFADDSHLLRIVQKIFAPLGMDVHAGSAPLQGALRDGSLVVATVPGYRHLPGTLSIRRPAGGV
ncbi:MAG: Flp pilus assembly complex ATPase component TadA [Candidatus Riflebacteria bacterium]|nr:Flp pilus assembly complex ATPase component TadA [Candidatus Riflebacteria bacterium]